MKIRCPRCKSKLEVEAAGEFVSCPFCHLEFTAEEPKPRRSLKSILSKINWFRVAVIGLATFLAIIPAAVLVVGMYLKIKNPEMFQNFQGLVGNIWLVVITLLFFAFLVLLAVNVILWIFLPLMVFSIKQKLEEAVTHLKKLTTTDKTE